MATVNLGRIKPVFKGTWSNSTAYTVDDFVVHANECYIAIQAGTNQNPASASSYWTKIAAKGSDGTDVGAALSNNQIAYKNNSGTVTGLSIGSAGQFLKVNSSANGYEYAAVTSDFVLLSTDTITSSTASVSRDVFTSDYLTYKVIIHGIKPVSQSSSHLYFRFRRSGADLTDSEYYNHCHQAYWNNSSNGDGPHNETWGGSYGRIYAQDHNTGSGYGGHYEFTVFDALSSTINPHIVGIGGIYTPSGYHRHIRFSSWYQGSNKDMSGIKIYFEGVNIAEGKIKIYGLK